MTSVSKCFPDKTFQKLGNQHSKIF